MVVHFKRKNPVLDIPDVELEGEGKLNYIILTIKDSNEGRHTKMIIRATNEYAYHSSLYGRIRQNLLDKLHIYANPPDGGGKLIFSKNEKKIELFGSCKDYGAPDHKRAKEILQKAFPDFDITISKREK